MAVLTVRSSQIPAIEAEVTGFADGLHGECEGKRGAKDTSVVLILTIK